MRTSRAAIDERLSRLEEAVVPHAAGGPVFVFVHAGENVEKAIRRAGGDENTIVVRIIRVARPSPKAARKPMTDVDDIDLAGLEKEARHLEAHLRELQTQGKGRKKR